MVPFLNKNTRHLARRVGCPLSADLYHIANGEWQSVSETYRLDCRERFNAPRNLPEIGDLLCVGRKVPIDSNPAGHHLFRAEPEVNIDQPHKASEQQTRSDKKNARQRNFGYDQRLTDPQPPPPGTRSTPGFLQVNVKPTFRKLKRWNDAKEQAGRTGCQQREAQSRTIHARRLQKRDAQGLAPGDGPRGQNRQRNSQRCATQGQQHAFCQQLPDQSGSAGPQRQPDRDLLLPRRGPGQKQVREIDAGNQQNATNRASQHQKRTAELTSDVFPQRNQERAKAAALRMLPAQFPVQTIHLQLRGLKRYSRLKPGDHCVRVVGELSKLQGHPQTIDFGPGQENRREIETRSQNANHDPRTAADRDGFADDRGISKELLAPKPVGEDYGVRRVVLDEIAAQARRDAQDFQESPVDPNGFNATQFAIELQHCCLPPEPRDVTSQICKTMRQLPPVTHIHAATRSGNSSC